MGKEFAQSDRASGGFRCMDHCSPLVCSARGPEPCLLRRSSRPGPGPSTPASGLPAAHGRLVAGPMALWWLVSGGGDIYPAGNKNPPVLFGGVPTPSSPSDRFFHMSPLLEATMVP